MRRSAVVLPGVVMLAFLLLPVVALIPMSLSSSDILELIPTDLGLSQYRLFFASPNWMEALLSP